MKVSECMTLADLEARRKELYWAIKSRVLTDEEMGEVAHLGLSLTLEMQVVGTIASCFAYKEIDKIKELNELLLQQFKLRHTASLKRVEDVK